MTAPKSRRKTAPKKPAEPIELATPVVLTTDQELDKWIAERNQVVFDPAFDAYRMRLAGTPWMIVAKANGYPSVNAAIKAVSRQLQKAAGAMSVQQQQEMLQISP